MPRKKEPKTRIVQQSGMEIKEVDEKKRTITAIASSETRDRYGDIVLQDGIDTKRFMTNPVVPFAHDYKALPVAKVLKIWKGKHKGMAVTFFKAQFATYEFAEIVFKLMKEKFLNAFSIGFQPKSWEDRKDDGIGWTRVYTKSELLEISVVPVPANPDAIAMAVKKGAISEEEEREFFSATRKEIDLEDGQDDDDEEVPEEKPEEKKGLSIEAKAALYEEHKAITKSYRKALESIRVLLGILPEEDEEETIDKTMDALKDILGKGEGDEDPDDEEEDDDEDNDESEDDDSDEDDGDPTETPEEKARPATDAEVNSIITQALGK